MSLKSAVNNDGFERAQTLPLKNISKVLCAAVYHASEFIPPFPPGVPRPNKEKISKEKRSFSWVHWGHLTSGALSSLGANFSSSHINIISTSLVLQQVSRFLKNCPKALARWLSWLERRPVHQRGSGSTLRQGTILGCWLDPRLGHK